MNTNNRFPFQVGQDAMVNIRGKYFAGIVIEHFESNVFDDVSVWIVERHDVLYKVKLNDGSEDLYYPDELSAIEITTYKGNLKRIAELEKRIIGTIEDDKVGMIAENKNDDEPHENF